MSELTQEQQDEQLRQEAIAAVADGPGEDPELCDVTPNDMDEEDEPD